MTLKENVMKELYENPVMNGIVKVHLTTGDTTEFDTIEGAAQTAITSNPTSADPVFLAGKAVLSLIFLYGW
jgi:hypothetical protein